MGTAVTMGTGIVTILVMHPDSPPIRRRRVPRRTTTTLPPAPPPNVTRITPDELAAIAEEAIANVRSVERRLLGLPVRGKVSERIDEVLTRRGFQR